MLYPYEERQKAFNNLVDNLKNAADSDSRVDLLNSFIESEKKVLDKINTPYLKSKFYRTAKLYLGDIKRWDLLLTTAMHQVLDHLSNSKS